MTAFVRHLRALASRYALAVAVCQVAVLGSTTIGLAASPPGALTVGAAEDCSCDHTAGVMCPMHRKSSTRPVPANVPRWCKGVDGSAYAVVPVLGTLTLPERVAQILRPALDSIVPAPVSQAPARLARPPDSPPPRA